MTVRGQLHKLDREARAMLCASCGLRPDGPGRVVYGRPPGRQDCAACGRPLYLEIEGGSADGRGRGEGDSY